MVTKERKNTDQISSPMEPALDKQAMTAAGITVIPLAPAETDAVELHQIDDKT